MELRPFSDNSAYIINFDGAAGDSALMTPLGLTIAAEGVPPFRTTRSSDVGRYHLARIDQFDGRSGQLSLDSGDSEGWQPHAQGVPPDRFSFATFMPAIFFVDKLDPETNTGRLIAYNYELDARTAVADGVSSFELTTHPWVGVLYAVPYGESQGLWFAKAK